MGWKNVAVARMFSRMVLRLTFVNPSKGMYWVRMKPIFSYSPFFKDLVAVDKMIVTFFSVMVGSLVMIVKSERQSVNMTMGYGLLRHVRKVVS